MLTLWCQEEAECGVVPINEQENELDVAPMDMLEDFSASAPQQRPQGRAAKAAELDEDELAALHDEMLEGDEESGRGDGEIGGLDADEMAELEEELAQHAEKELGKKEDGGAQLADERVHEQLDCDEMAMLEAELAQEAGMNVRGGAGQEQEGADPQLDHEELAELEHELAVEAREEGRGKVAVVGEQENDGMEENVDGAAAVTEEAAEYTSEAVPVTAVTEIASQPETDAMHERPPTPDTVLVTDDAVSPKDACADGVDGKDQADTMEIGEGQEEGVEECPETEIATEPVPMEACEDIQVGPPDLLRADTEATLNDL